MVSIGGIEIKTPLALAPMAGVTDVAFRTICREQGAGLTCTEMVSSKALCFQDKKSIPLLKLGDGEHPAAAQIFGSDPVCMQEAAAIAHQVSGADFIDINMGCPVPKVANSGDGSGLMRNPDLAVKEAVRIPVIANGDVFSPEAAVRILRYTGADMAMVGRGVFGNPWLLQQCAAALAGEPVPQRPPLAERCAVAVRQFEINAAHKGEKIACLEARRHYAWYLKGVPYAGYYKEQISKISTLEDIYRITAGIRRDLRDG